jgi:hypothetical protein
MKFRHWSKSARLHFVLTVVWTLLIIPTVLWWRESIFWIAFMSIYAIIVSHAGAFKAARAEQEAESE